MVESLLQFLNKMSIDGTEIGPDTDLSETVLIDSLATAELIVFLEEQMGLRLKRADLKALTTARSIEALVEAKRRADELR